MRIDLGIARGSRTKDRKLARIRRAMTTATEKYGIGGVPKRREKPRPVTLATTPWKDKDHD